MLNIELTQPAASFAPGEAIDGHATWQQLPEKTTALDVRLIWYTEGKGDTDVQVIANQEIPVLEQHAEGKAAFHFTAPNRPYSFAGKLIELTWAIELIQKPSLDSVVEKLIIHPNKQKVELSKSFDDSLARRAKAKTEATPEA